MIDFGGTDSQLGTSQMPKIVLQHEDIVFRQFTEPFSLDDLFQENLLDVRRNGPQAALHGPLVEDFSMVDLGKLTAQDIRGYVRKIAEENQIPREVSNNLVVCVTGDKYDFGMLRMYGIYAELAGVRDEENFLVTEDYQEGADWLMKKMGRENEFSDSFLKVLQNSELVVGKIL